MNTKPISKVLNEIRSFRRLGVINSNHILPGHNHMECKTTHSHKQDQGIN